MPNRTLCDVLEDMRKASKTKNFSYMDGLIEEAQLMGNRMEAGLWDQKDVESLREKLGKLKKEVKTLEAKKASLQKKKKKT